jgi:lysine-ketoglutarate reductase/saccharopine dehydrogenase-like protein (TIGR00300 family)
VYTELIELSGHIIDSLVLTRAMDEIIAGNGDYVIEEITIGIQKDDTSYARLRVSAEREEDLARIIQHLRRLGAILPLEDDARLEPAPRDGVFPEGFHATTNLVTYIRFGGRWLMVSNAEMDCGLVVDPGTGTARAVRVGNVLEGQLVVVGHIGVQVVPLERARNREVFSFMSSSVSSEKPKHVLIGEIAAEIRQIRERGGKIAFVAGPALVHTGAARYLAALSEAGYVQVVFGGNALAVHDIESALYGTSLGVNLQSGVPAAAGHEHHLRAVNTIRAHGSIRAAVEAGVLKEGLMYTLATKGVDYVLAGSIRDDGPLPDVITDIRDAQNVMRAHLDGVEMVIAIATMLHAIAVGNMLPAAVKFICVDINPAVVTKLSDRGSFQTMGIVTDVESFMRELCRALDLNPV